MISFSINSQELVNNQLLGEWKVENVVKYPDHPKMKSFIDGLKVSSFSFDNKGRFEFKSSSNSQLISMTIEMTQNTYWKFDKSQNLIKIGTPKDDYSIMGIFVKSKNNIIFFELQESGIILQMTKIKDEVDINFSGSIPTEVKPEKLIEKNPNKIIEINDSEIIPFDLIDNIPVTTDCNPKWEKEKLRKCFQNSITTHVNRKFNIDLASNLGLAPKIHKIITTFIIDKTGEIVNVHSEGSHSILNNEAARVISILPKMKPGMKDGKVVNVKYTLPIQFKVE